MLVKNFREPLLSFELMRFRNSSCYRIKNNWRFKCKILIGVGPLGTNLIFCFLKQFFISQRRSVDSLLCIRVTPNLSFYHRFGFLVQMCRVIIFSDRPFIGTGLVGPWFKMLEVGG